MRQLTELRSWATRLEDGSSEELRAAGRAIRMLVDEVEGLQAKLVEARAGAPPTGSGAPPTESGTSPPVTAPPPATTSAPEEEEDAPEAADPPWAAADDRTQGSFRSRLKRSLGLD